MPREKYDILTEKLMNEKQKVLKASMTAKIDLS
jgi:hypothetical protein